MYPRIEIASSIAGGKAVNDVALVGNILVAASESSHIYGQPMPQHQNTRSIHKKTSTWKQSMPFPFKKVAQHLDVSRLLLSEPRTTQHRWCRRGANQNVSRPP